MDGPHGSQGVTLQPVFIPRQHSGLAGRNLSLQHPGGAGSPTGNSLAAMAASADWAYLLRNAAALRSGSFSGSDAALMAAAASQDLQNRAISPQVMSSPGGFMSIASSAPQGMGSMTLPQQVGVSNSTSGMFGNNSMVNMDALGQLSADALAQGDPSNSFAMLGSGSLNHMMSGGFPDGGVQTLYGSGDQTAAIASAAAAAAAAATARATTTQSILQHQAAAAAAAGNANLSNSMSANALASLGNSLNLNNLMKFEESLSGTLFGPGGAAAAASPKPVSASLYIKNLPTDADKLFLYEKFSPYGAILSVKVLNDPQSGQCRGVGFVNFAEHTSAVRSIQALHGTKVGDKLLHVSLQTPRLRATAMACM